jgi:hypothetical protein
MIGCKVAACGCGVAGSDIVIAQNFLTEVYENRDQAIQNFESLVRGSSCRYLVFIENNYPETMRLMNDIAEHLYKKGLALAPAKASSKVIRPNFSQPEILSRHLYANEDGLRARKNVKFHHLVIEIAR